MATPLTATDIFRAFDNSGANLSQRMKALITDSKACSIINEALEESTLTRFGTTFKDPVALKALLAVRNGDLVLFAAAPEYNLPECIPFFRYVFKGKAKVAVNMTNIVSTSEDINGNVSYMVDDMRKLYAMLVAAYIQLKIPEAENYPIKAIEFGAMMWARMFCKVLNRTIGLSTNKERYEAYYYFAVRFFLINLIGAPEASVESISKSVLKSGVKSPLILMIEEQIEKLGINPYASFTAFCNTIFNNDISGIKGMRMLAANPNEKLNVSFYLRRYVDSYNQGAIMGLASVHYFTWMVLCSLKKAYLINIKMLGDVFDGVEGSKYLSALYANV